MLGRVASAVTAMALGACTAQGPTLNAQAEQMELALVACKAELGMAGQLQTQVSFGGGVPQARAVPYDQITAVQADQINACAGQTLTLADGMRVVPLAPLPVTPAPVVPVQSTLPVETVPTPAKIGRDGCPAGVTGMYAGTRYCTGDAV
mgnify:FL=1